MKYWNSDNKKEIIENYKKDESSIIITYLDGSTCTIPLSKENEQKILELMLYQARLKSSNGTYEKTLEHKKTLLYFTIVSGLSTLFLGLYSYIANLKNMDGEVAISSILCMISGINMIVNEAIYCVKSEELDEIVKYDLYLKHMKALENYNTKDRLFEGVKSSQRKLNINTLDDFSNNDLIRIISNLKSCEQSVININTKEPQLVRKK